MKDANPKLIGVFVIGGIILLVAALVLFSSQDLFTPKRQFVAYFQQSVNGLNIGAAVRFRGIPVGKVTQINGVYDPKTGNMLPRLTIEFLPETLENAIVEEGEYTLFPLLLKNGMRASLKSTSLLTGQLYVSLDFYPDAPIRTLGGETDEYPEMPTIESGLDEFINKLSDLPLEDVLVRAAGALAAAEDLLRNPEIDKALLALAPLLTDADTTFLDLRQYLNHDLKAVTDEVRQTLSTTQNSVATLTKVLTDETLVRVNNTLGEFESLLQVVQQRLGLDDPLSHELLTTLRELGRAAQSVRNLADHIEEHPESLLRGKTTP